MPSRANPTHNKNDVFVGNIPFGTTEEQLHQIFSMWKIPKTHSWGATSGALLRRRPGQTEREIRHRNRSRGNEVSAPLPPPSRPTHATSAVESGSPLTHSECAAPVENVRDIAEGHTGERVKPQKWLSPCSYGKDTATVLFSAPEASFASSDGASVEKQGLEGCNDHPSAEGRNFKFRSAGEGMTREVSITSASENNVREVIPRNPPTVPLKEVGNTPRKIGRAASGRAPEVQDSTPSAKAKKRRTPPNSGRGTPPHPDVRASRGKRTATNKPEVDSVWGAWHEQQQAALQHRNDVREDQLMAIQSPEEVPMSVSPCNSRRGSTRGSPGEVSTPSGHRNKRPGSPYASRPNRAGAPASKSKRKKKKATRAAATTVGHCGVEGVGSSSCAGSEQEQVAPAPTNGAASELMKHPDRGATSPDTDRGEHRARGERGRLTTRRSSSQGISGNHGSCRGVRAAPAGPTPVSGMRRGKGRKRVCNRDVCGMQFPIFDECNTCSSCGQVHHPASRLCFACHRPGPGEGSDWRHIGAARITEARQFLEACADDGSVRPAALVKNYQLSSDCLCNRDDCLWRSIDRHRIRSTRRKANLLPPVSCTPVTVGVTPSPTPAEPDFVSEVRQKVIATVEEGRLVGVEDVQSWLIEARTAVKARAVLDKRTREQALRIFDAVVADGAVDAKLEKRSRVDAAVCDGRRKFIYLVPSVVAPEVAIVADVQLRNMRTRVQELERSVSRLTAEIKTGQPVEHALQRVIAAGSEKARPAVVIAAGSIVRVDIESAHELRNVSGDRDQKYAADILRNIRSMNQFLTDETPPALLALLSSLCHLQVSRDDPDLLFPIGDEARSGRRGDSLHAPRTAGADDDDMSLARDGGAGLMGTASGSGGGTAQQENGGAAQGGSAVFRASARRHGSTPREKALRCACKPERAAQRRHRCRDCRYLGNCTLSCGCQGRCFLPPPPDPATDATATGDSAGGNVDTSRRRRKGRGGSAALRGGGQGSGARKTPGAGVDSSRGEEFCRRDGERMARVTGEKSDPGPGPTSHSCCDGGLDGSPEVESKHSAGIWLGDSDSECSDSEEEDSALEAGKDDDDESAF